MGDYDEEDSVTNNIEALADKISNEVLRDLDDLVDQAEQEMPNLVPMLMAQKVYLLAVEDKLRREV